MLIGGVTDYLKYKECELLSSRLFTGFFCVRRAEDLLKNKQKST